MADESPWQGLTADQLAVPGHDPKTCEVCGPVSGTPAWGRGCARAGEQQTRLPLSSAGRDSRPGRDGYELPE